MSRIDPSRSTGRLSGGGLLHSLPVRSLVAFLLVATSFLGLAQVSQAATPGISASLLLNGTAYNGTPVVDEGDELTLRVQYDTNVVPGSTVVFDVGTAATLTGVPPTNTAIDSVVQVGN